MATLHTAPAAVPISPTRSVLGIFLRQRLCDGQQVLALRGGGVGWRGEGKGGGRTAGWEQVGCRRMSAGGVRKEGITYGCLCLVDWVGIGIFGGDCTARKTLADQWTL